MVIKDGLIEIPDRPGTGFTFNFKHLKDFKI